LALASADEAEGPAKPGRRGHLRLVGLVRAVADRWRICRSRRLPSAVVVVLVALILNGGPGARLGVGREAAVVRESDKVLARRESEDRPPAAEPDPSLHQSGQSPELSRDIASARGVVKPHHPRRGTAPDAVRPVAQLGTSPSAYSTASGNCAGYQGTTSRKTYEAEIMTLGPGTWPGSNDHDRRTGHRDA